ncbi:MAG: hypothetical protein UV95_C0003G0124 [Candidatus Falkowbacteria bacterium GW2011_GWF2_43_32]|nr:MAG: hypothetical protein UV95_C0003G0124 [Candidatus Falkowbacteria bacterium GW2011_GWF2_43_32]
METVNIEEYARLAPQYYNGLIPLLLKKYLNSESYDSILDCGCGDGSLLYALDRAGYLKGKKILAIDLSRNRIEIVKKINGTINASVDSAENLETVADVSIDFFISTQVIEHVDDRKMIEAIKKKVRAGGIVYISTVFKKWYGWYFYRNKGKWVLDPTHLREYSSDCQLLDLFNQNNFQFLEVKKTLQWFPISDFFIKRIGLADRKLYENMIMKIIRKIKIPILGYYNWEIILKKI